MKLIFFVAVFWKFHWKIAKNQVYFHVIRPAYL